MREQEKSGVLIRIIVGLLGSTCGVSLAWSHGAEDSRQDRLERAIAPDDRYELCLVLAQDQQLRYTFSATQKLGFNIHYHADHEVFYTVSEHQTMAAAAAFAAQSEQEYCLMWTNRGDADVLLSLDYEKPQKSQD